MRWVDIVHHYIFLQNLSENTMMRKCLVAKWLLMVVGYVNSSCYALSVL